MFILIYFGLTFGLLVCRKFTSNQADQAFTGTRGPELEQHKHEGRPTASHTANRVCEVHWHPHCTIPRQADSML